jgi:Holliday junction resolvasome RuvABC ATP-dependent DNA helicase subunit
MGNRSLFYRDIIGQESAIARLRAFTDFFAETGATPGHILLVGEDGMGKASLATAVANERNVGIQEVDAATLEVQGDLTALLTNLRPNQILFLSNLHRLRSNLAARLSRVLNERRLEIIIGMGPAARTHVMDIQPFTLIAACPKKSDCPSDSLREFSLVLNFSPYSKAELESLAQRIAHTAQLTLEPGAAQLIVKACEGRPGQIEITLRRLQHGINKTALSEGDIAKAFLAFGIHVQRETPANGIANLQNLSGQEFEVLISSLLGRMGFHAEMTKTSGDGGIDIIAVLDRPVLGGTYLFQCKRFAPENLVGAPTVRDFYGAVTADRAVKGIFITTSDFTAQAREFGRRVGIELINIDALQRLLVEYKLIEEQNE